MQNPTPLITLLTDFGTAGSYVAQMRGVLAMRAPEARVVDITHNVAPQDVRVAALVLAEVLPWYPPETVHIVVVDPGVGTKRPIIAGRIRDQFVVLPDNGLITFAAQASKFAPVVWVENDAYFQKPVSRTFHGRDIMAPVAAALARGIALSELGPIVVDWQRLEVVPPRQVEDRWFAEIIYVDSFGNLITNLTCAALDARHVKSVTVGGLRIDRHVGSYGEAAEGSPVTLIGSSGRLEIAVVNGNASQRLGVGIAAAVEVTLASI